MVCSRSSAQRQPLQIYPVAWCTVTVCATNAQGHKQAASSPAVSGTPYARSEEVAWTLQTLSANALELSRLWHASGYHELLLCDVSHADFTTQLPMQVGAGASSYSGMIVI